MGLLRFAHVPVTGVTQPQGLHMCCHLLSFCSVYQYHCFTQGFFISSSCDSDMLHRTQYVTSSNSDIQWIIQALKYQQNKFSASNKLESQKNFQEIITFKIGVRHFVDTEADSLQLVLYFETTLSLFLILSKN